MHYRLVLALAVLCASAVTVSAQVSRTTIRYRSGSGGDGYDSASFEANYSLHACEGSLYIATEFVPGSYQWSDTYWFQGKQYPTPKGLTPTVRDQGTFNGTVRVRGGRTVGSFHSLAGLNTHNCRGDLSRVANLASYVDIKNATAIDTFIASLEVVPDTNSPYVNFDIENAIRGQIRDEKKKAEDDQRKAEEDKRRAEEDAKAEEERKRKADEELKRIQDEERKRIQDEERKRQDEAGKKAEDERTKAAEAEQKAREEEERKAQQESERIAKENDEARAKIDAEMKARADEDAAAEAKRKANDDAARAKTEWTDADDDDGPYWPEERCYWFDTKGYIHLPSGRHHCDPKFIHDILKFQTEQFERELKRLEEEAKAERARRNVEAYVGNSKEGAEMLVVAGAVAPLVDGANKALSDMVSNNPQSVDLETIGRVVLTVGTGFGVSVRYGGVFYVHAGYVSYDTGMWDRARAGMIGFGFQAPVSRRFSVRMIEIGATAGGVQHVVDGSDMGFGGNFRSGLLVRVLKGLSFTATLGVDSTGGWKAFVDLGAAWRFDIGTNRNYMYQ
jgi:flagellar biosynthesis GTPase FlhF